ncbi:hypothetical protein [Mycoplasma sp. Mirounga ES2805-ORL]|uniref:hypothetical protein n=1 Tax=Mycoplasma sp. Mirounga ES2805-ORL TaxID=754514 RepID=UPI00197B7A13|nr:hypothetical protein [Mycoplasma sp. Mirounga ES2805-ORL]QSF13748.1 hypothetical protein JXZ90_00395 [Mycoplasma sp. Mirounga ES2805-ORL]
MKIKFHSEALQVNNPQIIDFEAEATYEMFVDDEDKELTEYHTYQFKEPKMNESNRVEISAKKINIFAGPTTLSMVLNQKHANSYIKVDGQKLVLYSNLSKVDLEPKTKSFEYSLFSANDEKIGDFKISIEEL